MIEHVLTYVFPSAFALLPGVMHSAEAKAMLLAIGLQESAFEARVQKGSGPAHGLWQFEKGGGVTGVCTHPASAPYLTIACRELLLTPKPEPLYAAMVYNDTIACIMARLLLWTLPGLLPERGMGERGWRQYLQAWRPGNPRPAEWPGNFSRAWTLVE